MFTTVQGAQGLKLHLREYALRHRAAYAFGCTADGTPVQPAGLQPLVGCVQHDEAHHQTGPQHKPFTRALLVSTQLAGCSLSLTATPLEAKERLSAKAAMQWHQQRERQQQPDDSPFTFADSDNDDAVEDAQRLLDVPNTVSDGRRGTRDRLAWGAPEAASLLNAAPSPLLPQHFAPQFAPGVADATHDKSAECPKSTALEQAFPWGERMRLVSVAELAERLGTTRAAFGDMSDVALLDSSDALLSTAVLVTKRPAVLVKASTFNVADGCAFPLERSSNPGGNPQKTRFKWQWLGARVPGGATLDLPAMSDDAGVAALVDLQVLDPQLHAREDLLVIGHAGNWRLM